MIHNLVHSKIFLRNNNQTPNRHTTDNHYQQTSPKNLYKHLLHQVVLLGNSLFHNADIFNDRSLPGCKYPMEYLSIALFATSIKILSRRGCGSFWMSLYCACAAWHKIKPQMINSIRFMILWYFVNARGGCYSPEWCHLSSLYKDSISSLFCIFISKTLSIIKSLKKSLYFSVQ